MPHQISFEERRNARGQWKSHSLAKDWLFYVLCRKWHWGIWQWHGLMDSPSFDRSVYGRLWSVWQNLAEGNNIIWYSYNIMIYHDYIMIAYDCTRFASWYQVDFMLILFVILIYFDDFWCAHVKLVFHVFPSQCFHCPVSLWLIQIQCSHCHAIVGQSWPVILHGQYLHHASDTNVIPSGWCGCQAAKGKQSFVKISYDFIKVHRRKNIENNLLISFDYQL